MLEVEDEVFGLWSVFEEEELGSVVEVDEAGEEVSKMDFGGGSVFVVEEERDEMAFSKSLMCSWKAPWRARTPTVMVVIEQLEREGCCYVVLAM